MASTIITLLLQTNQQLEHTVVIGPVGTTETNERDERTDGRTDDNVLVQRVFTV